ncbi:MAG TPA: hypothetical protein VHG30_17670 [Microvirga sp.]|nr:hypothetical protein [Microvirga sp.]
MRTLLLSLLVASAGSGALAQPRANTLQMSCGEVRALVASQGAAILYSGRFTYDRFVRDGSFCVRPERTEPAWLPTADVPQCPVGYRCVPRALPFTN